MSTTVWPSTEVVNISRALVGIVVLRGMSTLTMPPSVSMPSDSGVTSSSSMSVMPPARMLRLHGRAQRDDLVGVELAVRRLAEELLHAPPHQRHARRAADQHDLVDVGRRQAGVGERHAGRAPACGPRAAR